MTAKEILAQVETQFQVMYLSPEQKAAILAQALRVCQKKIGPFTSVTFTEGAVDTPADFYAVAVATDKNGRWQEVKRVKTAAVPADGETPEVPATDQLQIVGYPGPASVPGQVPANMRFTTTFDPFYNTGRVASTKAVAPFTVHYFQDLSKVSEIPSEVVSLLFSYLSILIEIPNNQRARQVATTTGMQVELPSDEELKQHRDAIETEMEESQSIIPSAAVF